MAGTVVVGTEVAGIEVVGRMVVGSAVAAGRKIVVHVGVVGRRVAGSMVVDIVLGWEFVNGMVPVGAVGWVILED